MTQSDWESSHRIQHILKTLGCNITPNIDGQHVDVYNPKSEKVITINANGKFPPFAVNRIFATLDF